ncbi:1-phosphofructokinase [Salirhabdus euzebyi]|uniref:Tagatose-6-phosphate kinase n=1 Tax=Salirhabdus euzebyi TaxID=394506 RepID=A0A841QA63_9BACI|nr:1-phosphofructokinase [Salirhabdus euzebyi]MBB6455411.1 1-phosphofructokinase [Salirhabdus euzebyi]
MIYTLTPNPAIDLFVELDSFKPNTVNRTNNEDYQANGKAINISIMLKKIGLDNTALGFVGGFTGSFIHDELNALGIKTDFVEVDGITRVNTFVRASENEEYKIVNQGPEIPEDKIEEMLGKVKNIPEESILFVSGSLPKGVPDSFYVEVAKICAERTIKLVLDISSPKLLECLPYKPYLIKPNDEELAVFFGKEALSKEEIIYYGKELLNLGAQNVLISLGSEGSVFISSATVLKASSVKGKVVNTACAGDSLLAMFVGKIIQNAGVEEALKYASATGASTAFSKGLSDLSDLPELLPAIELTKYN